MKIPGMTPTSATPRKQTIDNTNSDRRRSVERADAGNLHQAERRGDHDRREGGGGQVLDQAGERHQQHDDRPRPDQPRHLRLRACLRRHRGPRRAAADRRTPGRDPRRRWRRPARPAPDWDPPGSHPAGQRCARARSYRQRRRSRCRPPRSSERADVGRPRRTGCQRAATPAGRTPDDGEAGALRQVKDADDEPSRQRPRPARRAPSAASACTRG